MTALDPLGPVTIGAREIYDQLIQTDRKVDKIDGKVEQIDGKVDGVVAEVADHENRIRSLERNRWPLPSLAALFGFASLVIAVITLLTRGG